MKEQVDMHELLKRIEWKGPSDISIGVKTCPYCGMRGGIRKASPWYQGHSEDCRLKQAIAETENGGWISVADQLPDLEPGVIDEYLCLVLPVNPDINDGYETVMLWFDGALKIFTYDIANYESYELTHKWAVHYWRNKPAVLKRKQ